MTNLGKSLLSFVLTSAAVGMNAPASAQFNFESLVNEAVNAAVKGVGGALKDVGDTSKGNMRPGTAVPTRPVDWPAKYEWHDYGKMAPQPTYNGRVKKRVLEKWENGIDFNTIPLQHAIIRVRGTGERKIAIVSDPLCPHSRALEENLNRLDNVTLYTFVAPTLGQHSVSLVKQINCQSSNRARAHAYENWILNGIRPPKAPNCPEAGQQVISAFGGLRFNRSFYNKVSPVIVFDNDIAATGSLSKPDIARAMAERTR